MVPPLFAEPSDSLDPLFLTATDDDRLTFSAGPPDEIRNVLAVRGIHGPFTLTKFPEYADPSESLDPLFRATADSMTFISWADMLETRAERGMLGLLGAAEVPL